MMTCYANIEEINAALASTAFSSLNVDYEENRITLNTTQNFIYSSTEVLLGEVWDAVRGRLDQYCSIFESRQHVCEVIENTNKECLNIIREYLWPDTDLDIEQLQELKETAENIKKTIAKLSEMIRETKTVDTYDDEGNWTGSYEVPAYDNTALQQQIEELQPILEETNRLIEKIEGLEIIMTQVEKKLQTAYLELEKYIKSIENIDIGTNNFSSIIFSLLSSTPLGILNLNNNEYGASQEFMSTLYDKYLLDPDSLTSTEKQMIDEVLKLFEDFKYVSNTNDNFISYTLNMAGHGGCGIASNANIIASIYSNIPDGEKKFEERFGFPLYYEDTDGEKHANFNVLFTKLYLDSLSYDANYSLLNNSENREYIPIIDDVSMYADMHFKQSGMTTPLITKYLADALGDNFIVDTNITSLKIDIPTYQENIEDYDYCAISAHYFTLKPYDDSSIEFFGNDDNLTYSGGHFMTITGLSENNNYIVSSWGMKFELVDCKFGDLIFLNVEEKNEN